MKSFQKEIILKPHPRGYHLITRQILEQVPEIKEINIGWIQLFIKHTSASLTINENADPSVRTDFESHMNEMVPEDAPYYVHTIEGPDDMPAHIKASMLGNSVVVPISDGRLNLGTWQGVYLCEHRDRPRARALLVTLHGETK